MGDRGGVRGVAGAYEGAGGVAGGAVGGDGAGEVRGGSALVAGSEVPGVAVGVVADGGLVEVVLGFEGEAASHAAGANKEGEGDGAAGVSEVEVGSDGEE